MKLVLKDALKELELRENEEFIYDFEYFIPKKLDEISTTTYCAGIYIKACNEAEKYPVDCNVLLEETKKEWQERNYKLTDLKIETIEGINWGAVNKLLGYYEENIKEYFICIEDIARFLNMEIDYVQKNVVQNLEELRFICSRDTEKPLVKEKYIKTKKLIKDIIYNKNKIESEEIKNLRKSINIEKEEELKEFNKALEEYKGKVTSLWRKKSLYSKRSFLDYLNSHVKEVYSQELVTLKFTKFEVSNLLKKYENIKDLNYLSELIDNVNKDIEKSKEFNNKKTLDIEKVANSFFININTFEDAKEKIKNRKISRLYSQKTLKILYDYVYNIEVERKLETMNYTKVLILKDENVKKAPIRYIFNSENIYEREIIKSDLEIIVTLNSKLIEFILSKNISIEEYYIKLMLKNNY
ncbi:hypothetical protein [Clostridium perfringens]|uniref:hypothetical protein n=1 Tax=Clostridium perfringens TaxID=1502 RepID=UPI000776ABE8|nr:hypothetical protein [Clostridium perfringens]AMN30858.1 hypothetical protein JFP55_pH0070 [Clostridium perfringens]MDM0935732.1 hypothetical protein [Clostridium perfringens]HAT4216027.1 hypothetical protein [Clostridium perfringens]